MLYMASDVDNSFLAMSKLAKEIIAAVDMWRILLNIDSN